jgi:hypothetical protein
MLTRQHIAKRYIEHLKDAFYNNLPLKFKLFISDEIKNPVFYEVEKDKVLLDDFMFFVSEGIKKFNLGVK